MTRKEAIEAIKAYMDASLGVNGEITDRAKQAIKHLAETADWITVGKRKPDSDGWYLTTIDGEVCGSEENIVEVAEWDEHRKAWLDPNGDPDTEIVYAWMPLPDPWKGDAHD